MDLSPKKIKLIKEKNEEPGIQLDDLNILITSFKRREENIIELLDLKLRSTFRNQEDLKQLHSLYSQIGEIEDRRVEREDQVLQRCTSYKTIDNKQKR